jgi:hypothetical protein
MAQGARVIDLDEYRRRRQATKDRPAHASAAPSSMVWIPLWMWFPYPFWPMR